MTPLVPLIASLVTALPAVPVVAGPPAPDVAVLVLSPWGDASFSEALLTRVAPADGSGWLRRTEPALTAADFAACGATGVAPEACIREVLAGRGAARLDGPPTVVVMIAPAPGFEIGWTCVGVGAGPTNEERQRRPGLSQMPDRADSNVQAAAGCILAAAAESGW